MPLAVQNRWNLPNLGLGVGLRGKHMAQVLAQRPPVDWFEVITDNHLINQGWLLYLLDQLRESYPLVLHGVTLNIGSVEPLDMEYLRKIKQLADRIAAPWVSDHVCWTGIDGIQSHDLLPVPYNEQMLGLMAARVRIVQDVLERPLVLENPSSYVAFRQTTRTEWQFIAELVQRADCGLLLDVNNVYVASKNHEFATQSWLDAVPWAHVAQFHVAGHTDAGTHLFDSHIGPVIEEVWQLFAQAQARTGGRATLLEWDEEIPDFEQLCAEGEKARKYMATQEDLPSSHPAPAPARPLGPEPVCPEIAQLQRWMLAEIVQGQGSSGQSADEFLLPNAKMTADQRLDIHRSMYRARTYSALKDDFPLLFKELGEERFAKIARKYRFAHPSKSYALELYGDQFADFLSDAQAELPAWLSELAHFEWALIKAQLAAEPPPLDAARLTALAAEEHANLLLHFAPSFQLLNCFLPETVQAVGSKHTDILVYRRKFAVEHRGISVTQAAILRNLAAGDRLGEALVKVAATSPNAAAEMGSNIGAWFTQWATDGLFVGFEVAA